MINIKRKNTAGFVLLSVILFIIMITGALGVICLKIQYRQQFVKEHISSVKAYYGALSGVFYIRKHYYNDYGYWFAPEWEKFNDTISIPGIGEIEVSYNGHMMNADITSSLTVNGVKRTVSVTSGDHDVPFEVWMGIYKNIGSYINHYEDGYSAASWGIYKFLQEYLLPFTRWEIKTDRSV